MKLPFFIHAQYIFAGQAPTKSIQLDHLLNSTLGQILVDGCKHTSQTPFPAGSKFDVFDIFEKPHLNLLKIGDGFLHPGNRQGAIEIHFCNLTAGHCPHGCIAGGTGFIFKSSLVKRDRVGCSNLLNMTG